jgi:GxxExxY protein
VPYHQELTERIIGLAVEVHRQTGPGLLESLYAATVCQELEGAGIHVRREVGIPAMHMHESLPLGFPADIPADAPLSSKSKQSQHYCRPMTCNCRPICTGGLPVGLLFNLHAPRLKDGLRRFVG